MLFLLSSALLWLFCVAAAPSLLARWYYASAAPATYAADVAGTVCGAGCGPGSLLTILPRAFILLATRGMRARRWVSCLRKTAILVPFPTRAPPAGTHGGVAFTSACYLRTLRNGCRRGTPAIAHLCAITEEGCRVRGHSAIFGTAFWSAAGWWLVRKLAAKHRGHAAALPLG